jgi:VWFA-related protein
MTIRRAAATLVLMGRAISAQEPLPSFTVRSDLVYLPTRVQDKKGATIYGLTASQFVVEDSGVRQTVTVDEGPDSTGISMVVVVQCSRSAPAEFSKLKGLASMVDAIAGGAPRDIAVLSYGEGPHLLGDFSGSPEETRRALGKLKPCGDYSAATIDAVNYAVHMLERRRPPHRRAILLVSETRDHGSRAKLDEVVAELGVSETVIYTMAFSPLMGEITDGFRNGKKQAFEPAWPPPKAAPQSEPAKEEGSEPAYTEHAPLLELPPQIMAIVNALRKDASAEIASLSGGEHFTFGSQKSFDAGLLKISNQVHNYYLLSFKPPPGTLSVHDLRVRVEGHPDAVIQTRRSYWSGVSRGGQ